MKLGPGLWTLICLSLLNRDAGTKAMVPTMPPVFPAGVISLLRLEKYRILDLLVVGNGGSLMLVCSNEHVTEGFSILVTHLMRLFGVSHKFEIPITSYRVIDSFVLLAGFEFSVGMYG